MRRPGAVLLLTLRHVLDWTWARLYERLVLTEAACLQVPKSTRSLLRHSTNTHVPPSGQEVILIEERRFNSNPRFFSAILPNRLPRTLASRTQQAESQHLPRARGTMRKSALVALADGVEDIELIAPIDILRRAGKRLASVKVVVASIHDSLAVSTAQGVRVEGDKLLKDISTSEQYDVIIIPGGMKGATNCRECKHLEELLRAQHASGRYIAAICASPAVVLTDLGLLDAAKAVAYPSFMDKLKHKGEGRVCVDKHFITSMGPGSAMEFGIEIVKRLVGDAKGEELKKGVCMA
ncbi:hypothetical protein Esti_005931 [Eimeria stiedai]